jgi:hypothetical protein
MVFKTSIKITVIKILKKFDGYSTSDVFLMEDLGKIFVRKHGNITRNLERYAELAKLGLRVPKVLAVHDDYYDMEYIPNLDIKAFLAQNQVNELVEFIQTVIDKLITTADVQDFTDVYRSKLENFDFIKYQLPFTAEELFDRLPQILPASEYHGDFTLDNILFNSKEHKFVLIDPITTEYASYVFDLAKLRQDLTCKWFIRDKDVYFDSKLQKISDELNQFEHYNNDYLLILMLIRVIPYARENDQKFLINEVKKLWK